MNPEISVNWPQLFNLIIGYQSIFSVMKYFCFKGPASPINLISLSITNCSLYAPGFTKMVSYGFANSIAVEIWGQ